MAAVDDTGRTTVRLKRAYGALYDVVTAAVRDAEPIGLLPDAPEDEYDPEVALILPGLRGCRDVESTQALVHGAFLKMFSPAIAGPRGRYRRLSEDVWKIWRDWRPS